MLYVIQKGFNLVVATPAQSIVYCITSVQQIINLKLDYIFTDGHAIDGLSTQHKPEDIDKMDGIVDWKAISTKYWKDENDLDLKRRKEAEFLVLGDIAPEAILGFIVYNEAAKNTLLEFGAAANRVVIKQEYYF